jgi:hypothetical protein
LADLRISDLPPLAEEDLQGFDLLALADLSASETKKIDTKSFLEGGLQLIDDGTIQGAKLVPDSVTATEIAPEAITASELADGAVDTASIQDLAVTNSKIAPGVDGAKLIGDSVSAAKISPAAFDRGLDKATGLIGHTNAIAAGSRSGITFDSQGHVTEHRALIGSDLPPAKEAELGGVQVPPTSGLIVSIDGSLNHANNIAAGTRSGITYDANGHVVSTVPLAPEDLPLATDTTFGAVRVPNLPLQVIGGDLSHVDSGAAPGSYTKVEIDQTGHVISATELVADDIPFLDASKITTGEFDSARIGLNSITAYQLADYGIAQVNQSRPKPEFAGQWWVNPVDRSAYIWIGTVDGPDSVQNGYWMNLGYGSAVEQNARFGGTYDAVNNVVESMNSYGNLAGVIVGQALPAPAQSNAGLYLIVTQAGMGTTPAPVEQLAIGDWIFSLGTGSNWIKIGVISGAGGLVSDEDVAVVGPDFSVPMPNVATQEEANELMWNYCQVASGVLRGTVKPSDEVLVDPVTEEMSIGTLDEGEYL